MVGKHAYERSRSRDAELVMNLDYVEVERMSGNLQEIELNRNQRLSDASAWRVQDER